MRLQKVATAKDVTLEGIKTELVFDNDSIKRMILRDAKGGYLEFSLENYSVHAYVPAPPEMKDKWKLSGLIKGIKIEEVYDDEHVARQKFNYLDGTEGVENLVNEKISVVVEE